MSLVAGFPGLGTHATDLAVLDQLIEHAAVRIQRAFRHFSRQRSSCLGGTVARPQPLAVCNQPEEEGHIDPGVDSSVADTEASQASTASQRFSCVCSVHAKLPSLHLATVGVLAGRSTPPMSHGSHLGFGHPDPR